MKRQTVRKNRTQSQGSKVEVVKTKMMTAGYQIFKIDLFEFLAILQIGEWPFLLLRGDFFEGG